MLTGGPGVGKTCAALCLCDRVAGRAGFYDFGDLCERVRQAKFGELVTQGECATCVVWPEDLWEDVDALDLFVVDEVGARGAVTDHQYEVLKKVLDLREGRPLVLITNLKLGEIQKLFDARVASRIAAGTVFRVEGRDRRVPF